MNKRNFIAIFMILLFLASSITVIAANPFRTGAFNIDNFIRGGWRGYDEVILFVDENSKDFQKKFYERSLKFQYEDTYRSRQLI